MKWRFTILLLLLMMAISACAATTLPSPADLSATEEPLSTEAVPAEPDSHLEKIKLTLLGDIMCHPTQYEAAWTGTDYDFGPSFADIGPYTRSAQLTLANLETTLAGKKRTYSGYPSFNTPEQIAPALKDVLGVDMVSTANNHSLDRHYSGLCATIDYLDEYGLKHTGTYKTKEDSQVIVTAEVNSLKIAFLSYTYGTNGVTLPPDKPFAVNYINRDKIKHDGAQARETGADLVIASMHWGQEYANTPSSEQTDLARWIFTHTEIDIISGNHVHTIQPIEFIRVTRPDTGDEKEGLVVYAQGNFISDQQTDSANMGIVVNLEIEYDTVAASAGVAAVRYFPCWVDETPGAGLQSYRVLHLEKALNDYKAGADPLLSAEDYEQMQQFKDLVRKVITDSERIVYDATL